MSRATSRGGRSPLLTATQLGERLPLPLLMVVEGALTPKFPFSTRAQPSTSVLLSGSGLGSLWINHKQWESVAVPLLQEGTVQHWRGVISSFGSLVALSHDVYGPSRTKIFDSGDTIGYTTEYKDEVSVGLMSPPPSDFDVRALTSMMVTKGSPADLLLGTISTDNLNMIGVFIRNQALVAGYK